MHWMLMALVLLAAPASAATIHSETGSYVGNTIVWDASPNLTFNSIGQVGQYFRVGGVVENNADPAPSPFSYGLFPFVARYRSFSDTDGVEPLFQDAFFDWTIIEQRAGFGQTDDYMPISLLSKPLFDVFTGSGLSFPSHSAVWSEPTYKTRGTGVLRADRLALVVRDALVVGKGVTIPTNAALYIHPLDAGIENYSVLSVGKQALYHEGPARFGVPLSAAREYVALDVEDGEPPAEDCSAGDLGRMVADDTNETLWVCFSSGWRAK